MFTTLSKIATFPGKGEGRCFTIHWQLLSRYFDMIGEKVGNQKKKKKKIILNWIYLGRTDIASILLNLTFEQMLDLGLRSKSQKVCFFFGFLWRGPLVFFSLCREGLGQTPAVESFWRPLAGCYMLYCSSVLLIVKIMTRNSWLQCPEGHLLTLLLRCISWGWCMRRH